MKKNTIFKGAETALITHTNQLGVDYTKLSEIIDWQIEKGINGLVICGTTGEAATLSSDEYHKVVSFSIERIAGSPTRKRGKSPRIPGSQPRTKFESPVSAAEIRTAITEPERTLP